MDALRAMALAWKSLATYPAGHPAVQASMDGALRALGAQLAGGEPLALGVAKDGFVVPTGRIDASQVRELAAALHRHGVSVLRLKPGLASDELAAFLRLVSEEALLAGAPPLVERAAALELPHVDVEAFDYSTIRATEDLQTPADVAPESLWEAILHGVLTGRTPSAEGRQRLSDPSAISVIEMARLIEECLTPGEAGGTKGGTIGTGAGAGTGSGGTGGAGGALRGGGGFAPGTTGADALGEAVRRHLAGMRSPALRQQTAEQIIELARALPVNLREAIVTGALRALAKEEGTGDDLRRVADAMAPDMVMRAFERIQAAGLRLSSHAQRLVQSLAPPPAAAAVTNDEGPLDLAFVRELSTLFREEDIDRFLPDAHQDLLKAISLEVPALGTPSSPAPQAPPVPSEEEIVTAVAVSLVEALSRQEAREGFAAVLQEIQGRFRRLLELSRPDRALMLMEGLRQVRGRAGSPELAAAIGETIAQVAADGVRHLVEGLARGGPKAIEQARRMIDSLGLPGIRALLLALAEEKDQSRRRRIFDLLASLGEPVIGPARQLLADPRWFVIRNMIALLRRLDDRSSLPEFRQLAEHPDLRVRLEAIKALFAFDPEVPQALLEDAILDPDPKVAEAAVGLAGSYGIVQAVEPLLVLLDPWDLFGKQRALRVKALRALGELGQADALPRLSRFFGSGLFPPASLEERRAAFQSLSGYPPEARGPWVERGLRLRDPEIRSACERLHEQDAAAAPAGGAHS